MTAALATRRRRAESMQGVREVRRMTAPILEVRESAGGLITLTGLASRTAVPYDMYWYDETIAPGAFGETLKRSPDVQLLINHDGLPLARTTIPFGQPGHLSLRESDDGLVFDAACDGDDVDVQRAAAKVNSGLMDQCSFAFRVIRQKWTWLEDIEDPDSKDQREILEVSLDRGDVSIVNYGANPATSVSVRALLAGMSDAELRSELDRDVLARIQRAARDWDDEDDEDPDDEGDDEESDDEEEAGRGAKGADVLSLDLVRARLLTASRRVR